MAGGNGEELGQRGKGVVVDQKVLIFGCAAVVLCALIALFTAYMAIKGGTITGKVKAVQMGSLYEAGELTTNLAPGSEKKYVKVTVVLEMSDKSLKKEIEEKLPVLKDRIIIFFNSKTSDDLQAENRTQLKKTILADLNSCLGSGKIKNIYFSDLVLQ